MGEPVERRVLWVETGVSVGAQHRQEGELPSADRAGTAPLGLWLRPQRLRGVRIVIQARSALHITLHIKI